MKILVTGAKGFVGKNLVCALNNIKDGKDRTQPELHIEEIFEYDIDTDPKLLDEYCEKADFVFNLAGVNRPENQEDFMKGNFGFASTLLDTLKNCHNTCPVMLSSSQQASLTGRFGNSEYGRSKKAGEELFLDYEQETGAKVLIYRFPNLFGKWCRPNYNSAVATFCNNIANDLPIKVNDPTVELELLYIDDLVAEMLCALQGKEHRCEFDGLRPIPCPSHEGRELVSESNSSGDQTFSSSSASSLLVPERTRAHRNTIKTADPVLYKHLIEFAKENRSNPTEAETALWKKLKANGLGMHFRRQHIIDCYIVDFVCLEHMLVVEVDGGYHLTPEQKEYDENRTEVLKKYGFREVRFTNEQVLNNLPEVLQTIKTIAAPTPSHIKEESGLSPSHVGGARGRYCYCPTTHFIKLGEIVDLLYKFAELPKDLMIPEIPAGSFAKKLYSTYLSYLPKEKAIFDLKMNCDARGSFTELVHTPKCGQVSVNISKPGITKGQHWHNTKWEQFIVVSGHGLIQLRKEGTDEVLNYEVSGEKIQSVIMLPGYTHNIINLSDTEDLVTVMYCNEIFDPERPDTFFDPVEK